MLTRIDAEGVTRIAALQLQRTKPATRSEAFAQLQRCLGVYDLDGNALEAGVDQYFRFQQSS